MSMLQAGGLVLNTTLWPPHLATVASTGWSVAANIDSTVLEHLSIPFREPHDSGIFLNLDREQTRRLSSVVADFFIGVEQASKETAYANLRLAKVWFQESTSATTEQAKNSVPFVPHIDGSRYFKIMVYIKDVGVVDGPMRIISQAPAAMEDRRLRFGPDYKDFGRNQIRDVNEDELHSLTGPRGSAVLFDTNTPHTASQVQSTGLRRLVRFDFSCTAWDNRLVRGDAGWRNLASRFVRKRG